MRAANYVRMTSRDDKSTKSVPIPVSVPDRCDHTARVCVECVDRWERDYIVHFRRTAAGRYLKETRDKNPPLTRRDVARYPEYYLGKESPGRLEAYAARCPHETPLTESCADCPAECVEPVCGPPPHAAMTRQEEVLVRPRHIAAWRRAGTGSWLVALPGQVVIRPDDRRAPGVVEIGPYERLAEIAETLATQGHEPTDRDLARACTSIAADLLPDTFDLDAWAEQAAVLHAAMTARGLARAAVTTTSEHGTDVFLRRWHQRYRRRSDGAEARVMFIEIPRMLLVSVTAWSRTATATLPTSHREHGQIAATVAGAACRLLDGEHPGPLWNADPRDHAPGRGHQLWRITHAILAEIAQIAEGPHAQLRALPDLVSAAVNGACTAAGCPASGEAWVRRQVTYWVLRAAEIPTFGPRDRRNPALLACLKHGHRPTVARQMRHAARVTADTADTVPGHRR